MWMEQVPQTELNTEEQFLSADTVSQQKLPEKKLPIFTSHSSTFISMAAEDS